MNSILKILFRQTENLLSLTKTSVLIYQLQNNLRRDNIELIDREQDQYQCAFSYDLCNELRLIQRNLHSTCFLLQRALYRIYALRKIRGELSIQINDNLLIKYKENICHELKIIQERISFIINENMLMKSPLNSLPTLFKQVEENFDLLLNYISSMPTHNSTIYLGSLVSNTLDRFYFIFGSLARLIMEIEEIETK